MTPPKWGEASSKRRSLRAGTAAQARRCPACDRKGALRREAAFSRAGIHYPAMYQCRWCKWSGDFTELKNTRTEGCAPHPEPAKCSTAAGMPPTTPPETEK